MPQVETVACTEAPGHTSVLTVTQHNFRRQHKPAALDPKAGEMILEGGFLPQLLQHGNMVEAQASALPVPALISATCLSHAEMETWGYVAVLLFSSPLTVDYLCVCWWFSLTNLIF